MSRWGSDRSKSLIGKSPLINILGDSLRLASAVLDVPMSHLRKKLPYILAYKPSFLGTSPIGYLIQCVSKNRIQYT